MLDEHGVSYSYRDYRQEPLTQKEIRNVLGLLGVKAKDVLRKNDRAYKELGLTGDETERVLIGHMAKHPGLLQRPIGIHRKKAAVGRPITNLLELVGAD
jgi:arsenate reductase